MSKRLASILPYFLLSCTSSSETSDAEFLNKCWGATQVGQGEFQLSFEAISFAGIEGGTYARSVSCPDARMRFSFMSPEIANRFRAEKDKVTSSDLGAGLKGRARVVPVERVNKYYLKVRVTRLESFERMSDQETQAFIRKHGIG